jgi:hypothetical protein
MSTNPPGGGATLALLGEGANYIAQRQFEKRSNAYNSREASINRDFQSYEAEKSRQFSAKQANISRDFQSRQFQIKMADMKKAGLNPLHFLGNSSPLSPVMPTSQAPSGASARSSATSPRMDISKALATAYQKNQIVSNMELQKSQADTQRAQAKLTDVMASKAQAESISAHAKASFDKEYFKERMEYAEDEAKQVLYSKNPVEYMTKLSEKLPKYFDNMAKWSIIYSELPRINPLVNPKLALQKHKITQNMSEYYRKTGKVRKEDLDALNKLYQKAKETNTNNKRKFKPKRR